MFHFRDIKEPDKFPPYSLPRLLGWHLVPAQDFKTDGKIFQFFGANWWDLLISNNLPIHLNEIELNTAKSASIVLVNLGKNICQITNATTGDLYNVFPGKRCILNNTYNKSCLLKSLTPPTEMHLTKIGTVWIILLNTQEIKEGENNIKNTDIFNDFLLMCGIVDKEQYLYSAGLESLNYPKFSNYKYIEEEALAKSDFTYDVLEHWEKINPNRRNNISRGIPHVIHWIWVRKDLSATFTNPLKPVFYKYMRTWINRNDDFIFNLWSDDNNFPIPPEFKDKVVLRTPDDIEKLLNKLPDEIKSKIKYLYKNHPNPGARSDVLRQVILYLEGGLYSDVNDGCCLAPMGKLLDRFDYIVGMEPVMYVNNAILGSRKGHPIGKNMLTWLAHYHKDYVQEWIEDYSDAEQEAKDDYIVNTTGPIALTQVIAGLLTETPEKLEDTLILPSAWIYPNYWVAETPGNWLKPVSLTAHYDRRDFLK